MNLLCLQVDLFFYREPEEAKEQNRDDVDYPADYTAGMCSNWSAQILDAQWVGDMAPPPIAGSPVAQGKDFYSLIGCCYLKLLIFIFIFLGFSSG